MKYCIKSIVLTVIEPTYTYAFTHVFASVSNLGIHTSISGAVDC